MVAVVDLLGSKKRWMRVFSLVMCTRVLHGRMLQFPPNTALTIITSSRQSFFLYIFYLFEVTLVKRNVLIPSSASPRLRCCATSFGRTIPKTWWAACSVSRRAAGKTGPAPPQVWWGWHHHCHICPIQSVRQKRDDIYETRHSLMQTYGWLNLREAALYTEFSLMWEGEG